MPISQTKSSPKWSAIYQKGCKVLLALVWGQQHDITSMSRVEYFITLFMDLYLT